MTVCVQGLVTTLHEGEDFGQLALLNDAPRAATIILREDNCHFLRVDKQDFIRILKVRLTTQLLQVQHLKPLLDSINTCLMHFRPNASLSFTPLCPVLQDVEANTVRLEEHGKTVLVLEKSVGSTEQGGAGNNSK